MRRREKRQLFRRMFAPVVFGLTMFGMFCSVQSAHAAEDEWTVGGGPQLASLPTSETGIVGGGAFFDVRYGLDPEWSLGAALAYSFHPSAPDQDESAPPSFHLGSVRAGVHFAIDILSLIPYVVLDAEALVASEEVFEQTPVPVAFGAVLGIGLKYRPMRDLSFSLEASYHALFTDLENYPALITIQLGAAWHSDVF